MKPEGEGNSNAITEELGRYGSMAGFRQGETGS